MQTRKISIFMNIAKVNEMNRLEKQQIDAFSFRHERGD